MVPAHFWQIRVVEEALESFRKGECYMCGNKIADGSGFRITCSWRCHEDFVKCVESRVGQFKKVTQISTGKSYRVPVRHVIENGLKESELDKFPEWDEKEETLK